MPGANDAARKIINTNPWHKGTAIVNADKRGNVSKYTGHATIYASGSGYDNALQSKYDIRFDDISYYTA